MAYKLSPSTLNLMQDCPRCFWLHFNKNIKRPSGPFPSLPSGIDKALKIYFDKFLIKNKLPPELKDIKAKLFNNKELLDIWRNNRKGLIYKDKKGNILQGAIDNILVKSKKLIVLDYKTRGYALKEDTHSHYINQLNLYNFLLNKNGYSTMDYSYLLFYYPKKINKNGFIFDNKLIKVKVSSLKGEKLFKKGIDIINGRIPNASKDCGYCRMRG